MSTYIQTTRITQGNEYGETVERENGNGTTRLYFIPNNGVRITNIKKRTSKFIKENGAWREQEGSPFDETVKPGSIV